jgi:hypothetical protein
VGFGFWFLVMVCVKKFEKKEKKKKSEREKREKKKSKNPEIDTHTQRGKRTYGT